MKLRAAEHSRRSLLQIQCGTPSAALPADAQTSPIAMHQRQTDFIMNSQERLKPQRLRL
jgi:hypothetical protein